MMNGTAGRGAVLRPGEITISKIGSTAGGLITAIMPLTKIMKGEPLEVLAAEGLMYHDKALNECQRECTSRIGVTLQLEQEAYLSNHPEIGAMVQMFISRMTRLNKRKDIVKEAGEFFTKPAEELDMEVRKILGLPETGPYTKEEKRTYNFEDGDLLKDLNNIIMKHYPPDKWARLTPHASAPNTPSSSFISVITSDSTLPTPEPVPTPEPTISEVFFHIISNTVDKAIFSRVDDRALRYDTAYVELSKCVEQAMEIPVIEIREDIAQLFFRAYKMFEIHVVEKERLAAEIAWEKRMRKKLKRTLRRQNNFKGYETPPTPKSEISSHESYKKPPPRPCVCHPQFRYNRYPKDRFGIYLPIDTEYSGNNMTATPAISLENLPEETNDGGTDTKSVSAKSTVSKKTTAT